MGLTVVSVAYPFAPVTSDPAGGAEQVLAQLDRALVQAGHRSIVVAQAGSIVAGELVAVPAPAGDVDDDAREAAHGHVHAAIAAVAGQADVVHLHGLDFDRYLPPPGPPCQSISAAYSPRRCGRSSWQSTGPRWVTTTLSLV